MRARVHITLRSGVLDPQGQAIRNALHSLGFGDVRDVRQGKYIELDIDGTDPDATAAEVRRMCETLLANPVIETYRVEVVPGPEV